MPEEMVAITGNTFPVKDKLKELGGRWDPKFKVWMVPKSKKMLAEFYVNNAEQYQKDEEEER